MAREFIVPGQMISGSGALDMAQDTLGTLGKKAMIVTDKVMIDLGNCAKVENALKSQGVEYTIYSEISRRTNRRNDRKRSGSVQSRKM